MLRLALICMMMPGASLAEGWQRLSGDQITSALTSRVVVFPEGVAQYFLEDGRTIRAGGWGQWHVEDDRYCENWSGRRAICAVVDHDGEVFLFREETGFVRSGRYGDL